MSEAEQRYKENERRLEYREINTSNLGLDIRTVHLIQRLANEI